MSYNQILTKGLKSALSSLSTSDGKLRLTTDTSELFYDDGTNRIKISDIIRDLTEEEIKNILSPLPKIYLSSDTHKLFIFDDNGDCVDITGNSGGNSYSINELENKTTTFNTDGSITETTPRYTVNTIINADGTITENYQFTDGTSKVVTTTFNEDGSITESVV